MKRFLKNILACVILISVISACYNDSGNYDYLSDDQVMPVKIDSIKPITVKANEKLLITPKLSNDDASRYSYMWFVISSANKRDTLSTERELSIDCKLPVDTYNLYFMIKDASKDLYKYMQTTLNVTATDITTGWYIMKTENDKTDLDYFSLSGVSRPNILTKSLNLSPLDGKPVSMLYIPDSYRHSLVNESDGKTTLLKSQSVYQILTNKSMLTLNAKDLNVFKTLKDEFYEMPSTINFQNLQYDGRNNQLLMNDGHLHNLLADAGIGKFGFQISGGYNFFPLALCGFFDSFFYDQNSKMLYISSYGGPLEACMTYYGKSKTVFSDSTFVMKNFIPRVTMGSSSNSAYAVVRGGVKNQYYLSSFGFWNNYIYPSPTFKALPATSELLTSPMLVSPRSASVIYYAKNNELKMYKVALNEYVSLKTFGAGETVGFIKNINGTNEDKTAFNDLVVITNSSTGYKVYRFPLVGSAGDINTNSSAVMTGTGESNFIMYRGS